MSAVEFLQFFISTAYFASAVLCFYAYYWLNNVFDSLNYKLHMGYTDPIIGMLVVAIVMFVVSIFGCFGNCRKSKIELYVFCILSSCAIGIILIFGGIGVWYQAEVNQDVPSQINTAISEYSTEKNSSSDHALDLLQNKHHCCGANNASDWINSTYWLQKHLIPHENVTEFLPPSCCIDKSMTCKLDEGNFYDKGCTGQVVDKLKSFLRYSFGFCFGLVLVQLFGIIIGFVWLFQHKRREIYNYLKINGGTFA